MKYESELINEILEQRGHEKSSIHYESECIESWIEETKGAYPKLCDYQSEWLNYIKELNGGGSGEVEELFNLVTKNGDSLVTKNGDNLIYKGAM